MSGARATVTVVITTYNHAHFLGEAVASVEDQTVTPSEVIVVDDGSSDNPEKVVANYPNVRLIRQPNQGLAAARNAGMRAATGDFIAFLDADDRLMPEMVETNLRQFSAHQDCGFVYGSYVLINRAGERTSKVRLRRPCADPYAAFLGGNLVGMHGTVLYRRDLLVEAGGFDPSLRALEDYDLYLRLTRAHPVSAVDEPLAEYRRHDSNMSNDIPYMLARAKAVLRRHEATATTRAEWRRAYGDGMAEWQRFYADEQIKQLIFALRARRNVMRAILDTLRVAPQAPGAISREFVSRLRRRLGTRRSGAAIRFGDLHRTTPLSREFGFDRGKPIDRRYVEAFLAEHSNDIRGRVLEVGDSSYTEQFGGDRVTRPEVLNRDSGISGTTFVGDLSKGAGLPSDAFDCIVLTQTLHLLYDLQAAIATLFRALKPGGVVLITVPWVSPIDRGEWGATWYWSISPGALEKLLSKAFASGEVDISSYGNVMAGTAFLYGLAEHEVAAADLDVHDPYCPVIVAGRAVKPQIEP